MTGHARAVVIGASAGAVGALSYLLPHLPRDFDRPIMVVVHVPANMKSVMADLLQDKCEVTVKEAEDKEDIKPGTVYFAPPDYHLLVETDKRLSLSNEEPVLFSRPSIDVLFETAAEAYGPGLTGIILTGANNDGAEGLRVLAEAGGTAIVQRPELAYASIMPQSAIESCPRAHILTLEQIAIYLQKDSLS